jgi:hypothetical protein
MFFYTCSLREADGKWFFTLASVTKIGASNAVLVMISWLEFADEPYNIRFDLKFIFNKQ